MDINDLLSGSALDSKSLKTLSKNNKADTDQVQALLSASLPILLQGMVQNSSTKKGAESLSKALDGHANDNIGGSLSEYLNNADLEDGKKILAKVLGKEKTNITKGLATQTKMKSTQVTNILATLAPLLLKLLFNQKESTNTGTDAISSMISLLLGGSSNNNSGISLGNIASLLLGGNTTSSSSSNKKDDDNSSTLDALGSIASLLLGGK